MDNSSTLGTQEPSTEEQGQRDRQGQGDRGQDRDRGTGKDRGTIPMSVERPTECNKALA